MVGELRLVVDYIIAVVFCLWLRLVVDYIIAVVFCLWLRLVVDGIIAVLFCLAPTSGTWHYYSCYCLIPTSGGTTSIYGQT